MKKGSNSIFEVPMISHDFFMRRCHELALLGAEHVQPNPMVGCVIVHHGKIVGEGYHHEYGQPHAEVNAINSLTDDSIIPESTLYVNLEPCAHHGKTPPCANLIVDRGFKKVVIGNIDSNDQVDGKGIGILKAANIEVTTGVLAEEGRALNKRFFCNQESKRPYVVLKWAETQDGFLDYKRKAEDEASPLKITSDIANRMVHKWRAEESAILVGRNTAILDNPSLTTRLHPGNNPTRVLIDPNLQVNPGAAMFDDSAHTIVFNALKSESHRHVSFVQINRADTMLQEIISYLHEHSIGSLMVEGGPSTHQQFIDQNLWDEIRVLKSSERIHDGVKAAQFKGNRIHEEMLCDRDQLSIYVPR